MASIQPESRCLWWLFPPPPPKKATLTVQNNTTNPVTISHNGILTTVQPNSQKKVTVTIGQTVQVTIQGKTQTVKVEKQEQSLVIDPSKASNRSISPPNEGIRLYPLAHNRNENDLKSVNSQTAAYITFVNETTNDVNVDWINYQGQRQRYKTLKPNEEYRQDTYVGHPWEVIVGGHSTRFLPTAGAEYTVLIGATDNPALAPLQGSESGNLRSTTNGPDTSINFTNDSASDANIFWINFQGGLQLYKTLKTGEIHHQHTYVNHPWEVVVGQKKTRFMPIAFDANVFIE